jgi:endonuclease YncB( thermonuclease family)
LLLIFRNVKRNKTRAWITWIVAGFLLLAVACSRPTQQPKQDFGAQSKKRLSGLIFGKDVEVVYEKTDQYGRLIGKILLDGRDINLEQVRSGMAWHYKEYEREQSAEDRELYARAEDEARSARRGLWVDTNPVEPGEFRKEERQQRKNAR